MAIDNQDIKQLINILQKMLNDNNENNAEPAEEIPQEYNTKIRDKKTSGKHFNKFIDMPEINMHKDDTAIDKKLNINSPTPRSRPYNFVDARCRVCGKIDSVNSVLVENLSRYKCNNCSTSPG